MTEEGEKKLSKKELKRLAKKAEKDAKKNTEKTSDADKGAGKGGSKKGAEAPAPEASSQPAAPTYFIANASKDDCASLKAAVASEAFGVPLAAASAAQKVPSIFSGPALFSSNNPSVVAFGGNGTAKAIALVSKFALVSGSISPVVDEWLEIERNSLRKSASAKAKKAAIAKIEDTLTSGNGSFLCGASLTLADIVVVAALSQSGSSDEYPAPVQHYMNAHLASPPFVQGATALEGLVPPPPFDLDNDPSLLGAVNSIFLAAITAVVPDIAHTLGDVIEKSKVLKNGDYQCKEAMPLFARLKASGSLPEGINSPQQIAQAIVKEIPENNPVVDTININGPGFILCKVKPSFLEAKVNKFMNSSEDGKDPKLLIPQNITNKGDTVVVDFSSPNIAKEMHVGHLRSTIIGESVCRILEYVGADVKRVNHVGDWGTQFGMLITYLKESFPNFGKGDDNVNITDLTQFYKNAKVSYRTQSSSFDEYSIIFIRISSQCIFDLA